jgi:hypothetical protein
VNPFIQKHAALITGILSGFDRLVFRGTLRQLAYLAGMRMYLSHFGILLKDFGEHAQAMTARVKAAATTVAEELGRPSIYLESARASKEDLARDIARRDQIKDGLVCVLTAVEPCSSYDIFRNREAKKLELVPRRRKCLHVYQYWCDPVFGFMNARIQTWYPFNIQICINGREWLARQMDRAGVLHLRRDNCFTRINNVGKAQKLMNQQLESNWPKLLDGVAHRLNPDHVTIFGDFRAPYYWSVFQSEWATDIMFKDKACLDALYPALIRHGMTTFASPDVMRFLGRKIAKTGNVDGRFEGEVVSDMKIRPEGIRIKHRVDGASVKAYNKQGSILRVETTIDDPYGFKVFRPKEGSSDGHLDWRPMRKGIADLKRRADVSQQANDRYVSALGVVDVAKPLRGLVQDILKPAALNGQRVRAINPWSPDDASLLETVMRGEFTINGFRNRDLRPLLFGSGAICKDETRRRSAAVSRKLRMLRAHGLIKKVPRSHRYWVTDKGRTVIGALIAARNASVDQLTKLAA